MEKIWHRVKHFADCVSVVFVLKYMSIWQFLRLVSTSVYLAVCIILKISCSIKPQSYKFTSNALEGFYKKYTKLTHSVIHRSSKWCLITLYILFCLHSNLTQPYQGQWLIFFVTTITLKFDSLSHKLNFYICTWPSREGLGSYKYA